MATEIQTALANEARRSELRLRRARLAGAIDATGAAVSRLSVLNSDAAQQMAAAQAELDALEAGAGPGVTDDFGEKSSVTQFLEAEREAAKRGSIEFIQANPECTEAEAAQAWDAAAAASHDDVLDLPAQGGLAMGRLYRRNLAAAGFIEAPTWEAQRAWIVATPIEVIMAI